MRIFIFIFLVGVCGCSVKRNTLNPNGDYKVYRSLGKALRHKDHVFVLSLEDKKLEDFPVSILELKNLRTLNLTRNNISIIPKEIIELENLQNIELMDNRIEKLPLEMSKLKNLKKINIAFNPITEDNLEFLRDSLPNCLIISYIEL